MFLYGIIRIVVTVRIWKFPGICTNSDNVPDATTSFQRTMNFLEVTVVHVLYTLSNYNTNNYCRNSFRTILRLIVHLYC